jgi:hypothetical protein
LSKFTTEIGPWSLSSCESLEEIYLGEAILTIGEGAFSSNSKLKTIVWPKAEKGAVVDKIVFYKCSQLEKCIIPEGVITIGDSAFQECSSLTKVQLPSSLESLGARSFMDCKLLT